MCGESFADSLMTPDLDYLSTLVSGPDSKINYYGVSYGVRYSYDTRVLRPRHRLTFVATDAAWTILERHTPSEPSWSEKPPGNQTGFLSATSGRIAIDGVANADTWQSYPVAQLTEPAFADVDASESIHGYKQCSLLKICIFPAILHGFGRACAAAGDACPLSSFGSAGQIVGAIHSLIDNLYFNPVPISPDLFPSGFVEPQYARELLCAVSPGPATCAELTVLHSQTRSATLPHSGPPQALLSLKP